MTPNVFAKERKTLVSTSTSQLATNLQMGLLDIIRKPKPAPEPCKPKPRTDMAMLASQAEFVTACLLMTDLPLPPSEQDEARKTANGLAVSIYRNIYSQQQRGPSPEMSDALILDIYRQVGRAFRDVGKERGELIESAVINAVVLKFLNVYRMAGPGSFFDDHLRMELQDYKKRGLSADWCRERLDLLG